MTQRYLQFDVAATAGLPAHFAADVLLQLPDRAFLS
jgi:hypothetical protein